jgi:hypothetical protein
VLFVRIEDSREHPKLAGIVTPSGAYPNHPTGMPSLYAHRPECVPPEGDVDAVKAQAIELGLDLGRRVLGSNAAAWPSVRARRLSAYKVSREMPCSAQNVVTAPRGASGSHWSWRDGHRDQRVQQHSCLKQ